MRCYHSNTFMHSNVDFLLPWQQTSGTLIPWLYRTDEKKIVIWRKAKLDMASVLGQRIDCFSANISALNWCLSWDWWNTLRAGNKNIFYRDQFVYVLNQCETMLHCNVVSHWLGACTKWHYSEVIMGAMVSQITGVSMIYFSCLFRRRSKKYQSLASLALVRGLPSDRWIPS